MSANETDGNKLPSVPEFQVQPLSPTACIQERYGLKLDIDYEYLKTFPEMQQKGKRDGGVPMSNFIKSIEYEIEHDWGKKSKWQLVINPNFQDFEGKRYISALLSMNECSDGTNGHVDVLYKMGIPISRDCKQQYSKVSGIRRFSKQNSFFGWDKFIPFEALGDNPPTVICFFVEFTINSDDFDAATFATCSEFLFPRNHFSFTVPVKCCKDQPSLNVVAVEDDENSGDKEKEESIRKKHLLRQWNNGQPKETDTEIICRDGIKFPVHSIIMSAASEKFAAHFFAQQKQTNSSFDLKPFQMEDIEPWIMKMVITFAYCGILDWDILYNSTTTKEGMLFVIVLKLWNATVLLKIREMEKQVCDIVMEYVRVPSFLFLFSKWSYKIEVFEGRTNASKKEFIGYLKQLRKSRPLVMKDFSENLQQYAQLLFRNPSNQ